MACVEFSSGRDFLVRVEHGSELVQFLAELAEKENIVVATLAAVGAVKKAKLGFYNQESHEYQEIRVDSPHEIACCVGNISMKDGRPFVHSHVVLADKNGNTKAGHLLEGTVFAAEVHLRELNGVEMERKYDEVTGLSLWETE